MKLTKILVLIFCIAMTMASSLFATLAYLTDEEEVKNTFTVGEIEISLSETKTDEDGTALYDEENCPAEGCTAENILRTEEGNTYHLIPGKSYLKDPAIQIHAGSEESYIRMILTVTHASSVQSLITNNQLNDYSDLFNGWQDDRWIYHDYTLDEQNDSISFEFRYVNTVSGFVMTTDPETQENIKSAEDITLEPLFTEIVVPKTASNEEMKALNEVELIVVGHAIQSYGFEPNAETGSSAEDEAWAAFDFQMNPE